MWLWGGYYYEGKNRVLIDDFNLLNEEEGLPSHLKIVDYHMGFGHDVVMTEKPDHQPIDIGPEFEKLLSGDSII